MKIVLEPYKLEDRNEVEELYGFIQTYYTRSPWPPSVDKIMEGGVKYFRALHEGKQIGFTGYYLKTPTLAETVKTTIFEEYRGKGLGKFLSQEIEVECKRVGVKKVISTIYSFNHSMVAIKLKQGYMIEGFHRDHEAPGYHEYSLGKILT